MRAVLFTFAASFALFTCAQATPMTPDTQFDFWLGHWDLTWADGGKGTNTITKELDGHVVHEHFNDPTNKYSGESWSVWDAAAGKWKQTWVDTQADYMTFEGGLVDDRMELSMHKPDKKTGQVFLYRMAFFNISPAAFDWEWKRSPDEGKTWELQWAIHYVRKG
ncbi:MAG: hypothetical protein IPO90_17095 [Flavobacteriales bacterium]|nr:hypothetical protein [Flavobacteriales bacterium]MBL0046088.1 hypothetical protein [Flavobacteriales bacterium]